MGFNYHLTAEEEKQCKDAYNERDRRGRDFERRLERLKSIGSVQLGTEVMSEWARQMKEAFMHCTNGRERIAKRYLTNDESWKELERILTNMLAALRSRRSITEEDSAGERILQSRFTVQSLLEACQQASHLHTIEFEEQIAEIRNTLAANEHSSFSVMSEWATEMKRTFMPDGVATDYLRDGEGWKKIKTMLDLMKFMISRRISVTERMTNGRLIVQPSFTAEALLDSIEHYSPPPANTSLLPSNLLAPARQPPPSSPTVSRVSRGRIERPHPSIPSIGSIYTPFQVGRRREPLRGTFGNSNEISPRRVRARLWNRDRLDGSERADRFGGENGTE